MQKFLWVRAMAYPHNTFVFRLADVACQRPYWQQYLTQMQRIRQMFMVGDGKGVMGVAKPLIISNRLLACDGTTAGGQGNRTQ